MSKNFTIEVDEGRKVFIMTVNGVLNLEGSLELMRQLRARPDYADDYSRIYDFRYAILDLGISDIKAISQYISEQVSRPDVSYKVAFLTRDKTEREILELYRSLSSQALNRSVTFCESMAEAFDWIG